MTREGYTYKTQKSERDRRALLRWWQYVGLFSKWWRTRLRRFSCAHSRRASELKSIFCTWILWKHIEKDTGSNCSLSLNLNSWLFSKKHQTLYMSDSYAAHQKFRSEISRPLFVFKRTCLFRSTRSDSRHHNLLLHSSEVLPPTIG